MPVRTLVPAVLLALVAMSAPVFSQNPGAPETFTANLQATGATGGAAAATIDISVRRYTPEADRKAVEEALKTGGYAGFLAALRKAPEVGNVTVADRKWAIRWAREQPSGKYTRRIVVVTDQPIFFVGGGRTDAKPREGYEVAVIQFEVDNAGMGKGSMAAAARVKPGGEAGVQIDDYADKPINLTTVVRKIK
jgi:hypothetical protein